MQPDPFSEEDLGFTVNLLRSTIQKYFIVNANASLGVYDEEGLPETFRRVSSPATGAAGGHSGRYHRECDTVSTIGTTNVGEVGNQEERGGKSVGAFDNRIHSAFSGLFRDPYRDYEFIDRRFHNGHNNGCCDHV